MQEQVANLKQRVDAIRKTGKVPHWRMVYAEYLLNRAQEYLAVDREPEARLVAAKIDRWIVEHTPPAEEHSAVDLHPMEFWNKDLLAGISSQIKKTLSAKRLLVPSTERDSILRRLDVVEGWIGEGKFLKAHDELLSLRSSLIARLRRSYRARLAAASVYQGGTMLPGTQIGPYNARHTLEETFHIVGERDPIWVEDFLEIYNELFKIVERLVPQEKK
ncbi:MAG: hypothetical protein IKN70_12390 [Fibrobacter sp.]|uniref:hypothetical protein n=1 Tax=Fibrobacter sp. TaxID=35828 RepID=UPI001B1571C1|nr:hypothetical protein [Fibrobacter sp.]MBO7059728.1 hypothetical protein [Fibrobacter sp.]MBR3670780.1 hypothetical protein [Fibrobacter sp.]